MWIYLGIGFLVGATCYAAFRRFFLSCTRFVLLKKPLSKLLVTKIGQLLRSNSGSDQYFFARHVIDAAPVGVLYLDRKLNYTFANATYAYWRNRPLQKIIGKPLISIIGETTFEALLPHINMVFDSAEKHSFETRVKFKSGTKYASVIGIPDIDATGVVVGVIVFINDTTEQKTATAELTKARDAADSANRAKSAFLANMSHEIRTPLGAVMGYSELMGSPSLSRLERAHYLEAIRRNGELVISIINDVLDLSKVEAEKLEIDKQLVTIDDVLIDVTTTLRQNAQEKGLEFSLSVADTLPRYIRTDSLRLRQILINVVGNAIKFTEHGKIDVRVKNSMPIDSGKLTIEVQDTGSGLRPDESAMLFRPFTQIDTQMNRRLGGTGLGLVLSRRMAKLLGGDVTLAKTSPGTGSTFIITINTGQNEKLIATESDDTASVTPDSVTRPIRLNGIKVLLAEDSVDNRHLVMRFLKLAGAEVDAVENGRQAVDQAERKTYDVLLMDLQMPVMDGFEAVAILRERGNHCPIIALTAFAMVEQRAQCLECGFNDHLAKPVNKIQLINTVALYARMNWCRSPVAGTSNSIWAAHQELPPLVH